MDGFGLLILGTLLLVFLHPANVVTLCSNLRTLYHAVVQITYIRLPPFCMLTSMTDHCYHYESQTGYEIMAEITLLISAQHQRSLCSGMFSSLSKPWHHTSYLSL